jgi:hypothetical protein
VADSEPSERPQFVCPLTLKEMNGVMPFVYLRPCGCVFAVAGLNAVRSTPPDAQSEKDTCPQCATKYSHALDCIPLNPAPEEEERLRDLLSAQRLLEPVKKSKKRKAAADLAVEPPAKKVAAASIATASNSLRSTLALEEAKRKAGMTDAVRALYTGKDTGRKETFMTMGTFTRVSLCVRLHLSLC